MREIKILVVEDEEMLWKMYIMILTKKCDISEANIIHARWYTEAKEKIESEQYDLIFLDHRMPYDNPGYVDTDMSFFHAKLQNIGYGLLPFLEEKQPNALIVGTSSLDAYYINPYDSPKHLLDKADMMSKLPEIIRKVSAW